MESTDRTRFIHQWWDRDPEGIILDKYKPPLGKRCPNGNVWGHTTEDLFMIQRIPGVDVVTCYSRSMIKELNERPIDPGTEPATPRVRRPYPLLKLAPGVDCEESFKIGFKDEGSDHGDPVAVEEEVVEDESSSMATSTSPENEDAESGDHLTKAMDPTVHMKLEECIPKEFLPDTIIVHDPQGLSYGTNGDRECDTDMSEQNEDRECDMPEQTGPFIYTRLYPVFREENECQIHERNEKREAHLYLDLHNYLGVGHHSNVYSATLTLPDGLSARTPTGQVTVAAKTAFPNTGARALLANEGKIYNEMPRHMSEEWCGLNMVPPLIWPVPVGPIVPKFYGYYIPTTLKKELSPILLMEECGRPVELGKLSNQQRTECYSLFLRLHAEGFLHESTYVRNIVMQPGPLTRHPSERSLMTASFRLIDFGRTKSLNTQLDAVLKTSGLSKEMIEKRIDRAKSEWGLQRAHEEKNIEDELLTGLRER